MYVVCEFFEVTNCAISHLYLPVNISYNIDVVFGQIEYSNFD